MAVYDSKVLNGEHLSYLIGLIKTALSGKQPTIDSSHKLATNLIDTGNDASFVSSTEKSTWSGKQDALVFNTTYNPSSNKVATMSDLPDISGKQDALVFNTAYDATDNKVATMSDLPDISGKQDALVFNTAYNSSTNKVATMSDVNGKQDALVFNTTYNASTNKVATMSDIPDVSGKQDNLVFNTAYDASTNKVATMSDIPDVSGKQDALVFNSTYNASSNKVATMADIPSVAGFQTASDVSTAISTALSGLTTFHFEVVNALPQSNQDSSAIYLVPKSTSSTNNIYEEWAWVKTGTETNANEETVDVFGWEHLGDTQVEIASLSNTEIQTIWESVS